MMLATQVQAYFLTFLFYQFIIAAPDNPPIPSFDSATDTRFANTSLITYDFYTSTNPGTTYSPNTVKATTRTNIRTATTATYTVPPETDAAVTITGTTYTGFLANSTVHATTISATTKPGTTLTTTIDGYTSLYTITGTTYTYTASAYTTTVLDVRPAYCPNPHNYNGSDGYLGSCGIRWGDNQTRMVAVYFWPSPDSDFSCVVNNDTHEIFTVLPSSCPVTAYKTISSSAMLPTAAANDSGIFTAVLNGYTFTSPSVYLSVGAISGLGITLTDVVIPYAPGELSTGAFRNSIGTFNPADFPCPPCTKFISDNWYNYKPGMTLSTYGPVIAPPVSKFYSLVPEWAACSCGVDFYAGYDPPIALTKANALIPPTTTSIDPHTTTKEPATGGTALPQTAPPTSAQTTTVQTQSSSSKPQANPSTGASQGGQQTSGDPGAKTSSNAPVVGNQGTQQASGDPGTKASPNAPVGGNAGGEQASGNSGTQASANAPAGGNPSSQQAPANPTTTSSAGAPVGGSQGNPQGPNDPGSQSSANAPVGGNAGSQQASGAPSVANGNNAVQGGQQNVASTQGSPGNQANPGTRQGTAGNQGSYGSQQAFTGNQIGTTAPTVQGGSNNQVNGLAVGGASVTTPGVQANNPNPVISGTTIPIPTTATILTLGSNTITASSVGALVVGGNTLAPGSAPITLSGTTISLAPAATNVVIDGSTVALGTTVLGTSPFVLGGQTTLPVPTTATVLTLGSNTITANSVGAFIVDGKTLAPGSTPITVSGTTISLAPPGPNAVIDGSTVALGTTVLSATASVVGGQTITPTAETGYVIDGKTLVPGGSAVTISGTTFSLPSSGANIVIDGSTTALSTAVHGTSPFVIAGQTLTPTAAAAYLINGQTLAPGGSAVTVNGIVYSLAPTGTSGGLGGIIISGFGASITGGAQTYTGAAAVRTYAIGRITATLLALVGFGIVYFW